ncbi:hypothetical protein BN970_04941 [Mycolicibacterium conceptionense]|uniref:Uncharacterized protein n=1 Tax=Mycolicibacterium conceptionense TaxID=451644 RepID=A0A0U1DR87_9MYCO|nr:hypothetical protein [Mycolicibacterium conceptionense]ORV30724.1 hypothetical protein AWB98_05725 [Mycolicibacterium conceptionense]CQD21246.1 hypothetical protein BN970_04941 [Mycolicibacterium conceptionense]
MVMVGADGTADANISEDTRRELVRTHFLINSARGNRTLRVTSAEASRTAIAQQLIGGVDLTDARYPHSGMLPHL